MINKNLHSGFLMVSVILVLVLSASNSLAYNNDYDNDKTLALVVGKLAAKLKSELAPQDVSVNLIDAKKESVSRDETMVTGSASCFFKETETAVPVEFEAKFDAASQTVEYINYIFLDSQYAPATEEEFLMKYLLNELSKDYKTEDVVIAIDSYDAKTSALGQKEFTGSAEVRIGQVGWQKINFDVLTTGDNEALRIKYELTK